MAKKGIEELEKEVISDSSRKGKHFFRNVLLFGFLFFLIAGMAMMAYDEYLIAQRFKEINKELEELVFNLKLNLTQTYDELEQMGGTVESYKGKIEYGSSKSALPVKDVTETKESSGYVDDDKDKDGIPDSVDTNPEKAEKKLKAVKWNYQGNVHTVKLSIDNDWYDYYKNRKRATSKEQYVTPSNPVIVDLSGQLREIILENNYKSFSEFVISFVQAIPYKIDEETKGKPYPRYPVETLYEFTGDCEDLTFLGASILINLNIDVVLLDVPGHIVVGVACDNCEGKYWDYNGRKYYYLETTARGYKLGEAPEEYAGYDQSNTLVRGLARI